MSTPIRQESFAGGETSPRMSGRTALQKYGVSVRRARNFLPTPEGAMLNRAGSSLVREAKDSAAGVDRGVGYIPFVFSEALGQVYVLELGELYVRFHVNGATVADPNVPANPYQVVSPFAAADVPSIQWAQVGDVLWLWHPKYQTRLLQRYGHQDWRFSTYTPVVQGGVFPAWCAGFPTQATDATHPVGQEWEYVVTRIWENGSESVPSLPLVPPARVDAMSLKAVVATDKPARFWWDSTGALFGVYKGKHGIWGFVGYVDRRTWEAGPGKAVFVFEDNGIEPDLSQQPPSSSNPFVPVPAWANRQRYEVGDLVTNDGGKVYRCGRAGCSGDVGPAGVASPITDGATLRRESATLYNVGDLRFFAGFTWRVGIDSLIPRNTGADESTAPWDANKTSVQDGNVSWSVVGRADAVLWDYVGTQAPAARYPACGTFFEQRAVFAAQDSEPEAVRLSEVDNFLNVVRKALESNDKALKFTLAGPRRDRIRWVHGAERLIVGTSSSIWSMGGEQDALAGNSFRMLRHSQVGAAALLPLEVGEELLYVRSKGSGVRSVSYEDPRKRLTGRDLTLLARHLFTGYSITRWCYAEDPWSVIWAVRSDGKLLSLTYVPEEEVWAWAWHDTDGVVEDVCAIPEGAEDRVYLLVRRQKGDGSWHRYIERVASRILLLDANGRPIASEGVFLDSSITVRNVAAADPVVVAGLAHLEGREVVLLADGQVIRETGIDPTGPIVVTGGQISFANPAGEAAAIAVLHVGLPYTSELELLPLVVPGRELRSNVKQVSRVIFEVEDTRGIEVAERVLDDRGDPTPDEDWNVWQQRDVLDAYGAPALYTGEVDLSVFSTWNRRGVAALRQRDPLPCAVLAVTREVEIGGT